MRLVVDLQGAQGTSRRRGIGRYCLSLAQGLARMCGEHELFIALNRAFPETIGTLRAQLGDRVPRENFLVWQAPTSVCSGDPRNDARRHAAELMREGVLASVSPDFVLVASVFEGMDDDVVTSIGQFSSDTPTAAVLFDLIPFIHKDIYLTSAATATWYENKLAHIRNAELLLTISESARREAIEYLGVNAESVVNISTAADDHFTPATPDAAIHAELAQKFGIVRPFVMYTGGIDHRKNIARLIKAYARLPNPVRRAHQLAIICAVTDADRTALEEQAATAGLVSDEMILTGFLPESDLLACYRTCKMFVFPSWHEGFGLPALEAMRCGRAVIAGDKSSLPEVVGLDTALFNPFDVVAISDKIEKVLVDDAFRATLERHGLEQAGKFSWDETARRTWQALEARHVARTTHRPLGKRRPRLAFVAPLQPLPSGIADYCAELLPELARHYRIEVITQQNTVSDAWVVGNAPVRDLAWFSKHAHEFDRILYQFGNSDFHGHMFELLRDHPGVVVLHDFFLSGVIAHRDATGNDPFAWRRALINTHGWPAILHDFSAKDGSDVTQVYPANLQVLQDALGVIVHSGYSRELARRWYGADADTDWHTIPHLRRLPIRPDRNAARRELGLSDDDFVVCSFGIVSRTKLNHRLMAAWEASALAQDPRCRLVFVGQAENDDYGIMIDREVRAGKTGRIEITGRVETTLFRSWLAAADLGVQLRTTSRGESSGTVLDCMSMGIATIVNANGSMAELPNDCVWALDDDFEDSDLVAALNNLYRDHARRQSLGEAARSHIAQHHKPRLCAVAYANAIEASYTEAANGDYGLTRALLENGDDLTASDWSEVATGLARNFPPVPRIRHLLVDISALMLSPSTVSDDLGLRTMLVEWLSSPHQDYIIELIYAKDSENGFRYAHSFTCRLLEVEDSWSEDAIVDAFPGDLYMGLAPVMSTLRTLQTVLQDWHNRGASVHFVMCDPTLASSGQLLGEELSDKRLCMQMLAEFDGIVCTSSDIANDLWSWFDLNLAERPISLAVDWLDVSGHIHRATGMTLRASGDRNISKSDEPLSDMMQSPQNSPRARQDAAALLKAVLQQTPPTVRQIISEVL